MTWKNLKINPPKETCYICVAFRENDKMTGYLTFFYDAKTGKIWESGHSYSTESYGEELFYINLSEITLG